MTARTCACGTAVFCADLDGWDVWLDQHADGYIDVVDGRAIVNGRGTYRRHTCAATAPPKVAPEPVERHEPVENLRECNERRQREAATRAIAAIRILDEHGVKLGPVATAAAQVRVAHPDKTYSQLATIARLGESAVNHAMGLIEAKARLIRQAA